MVLLISLLYCFTCCDSCLRYGPCLEKSVHLSGSDTIKLQKMARDQILDLESRGVVLCMK